MRSQHLPSRLFILLSVFGLTVCTPEDTGEKPADTQVDDTYAAPEDADRDGVTAADGDCDDQNPDVYPGHDEECNGVDDNCNGRIDEGFADADGDSIADCVDDEECDGFDNDGDGVVDEGFADTDGDGIADCVEGEACDGLDNNGDGRVDEGYDFDSDGYTQCGTEDIEPDCDDDDPRVYPGATENPSDTIDNDCDGLIDEGVWAAGDLVVTEIMANPDMVSDAHGEWLELHNASGHDIYLNGIVILSSVDEDWHQITSDELLLLPAGECALLGLDGDPRANGGVDLDYIYTDIILSNETDDLLVMAEDVVLDQVSWDDGLTMPDVTGASMSLDPWYYDATANDTPGVWCDADLRWGTGTDMGSPGEENEFCASWDHDGDGYSRDDGDCDDGNDRVYPGAPEVDYGVDNDCDGDAEMMPTGVADYDPAASTLVVCDPLYLDGSGSFDPDGSALTYQWEVVTVPSGSRRTTADLDTSTSMNPVFHPDVEGTYDFSLVVNDGGTDSYTSTLSLTIAARGGVNNPPVAEAGADQTISSTSTCTLSGYTYTCEDCADYDLLLDGTGSTDADGDFLEYSWSVTSGSSYGSLSGSTSATPTLTISGVSATYGSTTTQTIQVEVDVMDCPGETSSDTVTITFSCTGV